MTTVCRTLGLDHNSKLKRKSIRKMIKQNLRQPSLTMLSKLVRIKALKPLSVKYQMQPPSKKVKVLSFLPAKNQMIRQSKLYRKKERLN
jgi:hypothetical protein